MQRRIAFVLGKKLRPGTIIDQVLSLLGERGVGRRVLLPHREEVRLSDTEDADLVVHRGLSGPDEHLLSMLAATSTPLCNPWAGITHLRDRAALHDAIEEAGVPTARGVVRQSWAEVLAEERH